MQRSLDVLGDPWVLLIMRDVLHGHGRFDELRSSLGIGEAVLSRRLRAMVASGLLVRVDYADHQRTRQGYAATPAGAEILPILQQLAVWAERHTVMPAGGEHMAMVHRACGQETTQGQVCSACGRVLVAEEMAWVKPWRGAVDHLVGPGVLAAAPRD